MMMMMMLVRDGDFDYGNDNNKDNVFFSFWNVDNDDDAFDLFTIKVLRDDDDDCKRWG